LLECKTKLLRKCCLKPVCMFKHTESYLLLQYNFFNPKSTGPDRHQIIKYTVSSNGTIEHHKWSFSFFMSQVACNHNYSAAFATFRGPYYFKFSGTVNVTCFCLTAAPCLHILQYSEAVIIAWWAQWSLDNIRQNYRITMHTGCYWCQIFRPQLLKYQLTD